MTRPEFSGSTLVNQDEIELRFILSKRLNLSEDELKGYSLQDMQLIEEYTVDVTPRDIEEHDPYWR